MKKKLCIALSCALSLGLLASCGNGGNGGNSSTPAASGSGSAAGTAPDTV